MKGTKITRTSQFIQGRKYVRDGVGIFTFYKLDIFGRPMFLNEGQLNFPPELLVNDLIICENVDWYEHINAGFGFEGMPQQCIDTAQAIVSVYGYDRAIKFFESNIATLNDSYSLLVSHGESVELRLKIALQSDFWTQVKQAAKKP